jgi:uncharacterized protein
MRLVLIGLAAGVFSALFGVGGGVVIVPLLLLGGAFDERSAAATSLAAIGLIATAGVIGYAVDGHVELGPAALVGIPAAIGAVGGAVLQQRLSGRTLTLAFSLLVAGVGVRLVLA